MVASRLELGIPPRSIIRVRCDVLGALVFVEVAGVEGIFEGRDPGGLQSLGNQGIPIDGAEELVLQHLLDAIFAAAETRCNISHENLGHNILDILILDVTGP